MMKSKDTLLIQLSWSLCAALLVITLYGYQAFNGDQEEHLPYAFALNDPALYPYDYLVPHQLDQVTVRFYFGHSMAFLFRWFPEKATVFAVYLLSLVLTVMPLLRLCFRRSEKAVVMLLAALAFVFFNRFSIGGNAMSDVQLTCSSIAFMFCAWALDGYDRKKPLAAACLCALASLFQVLFGLQLFGLLFLVYVFEMNKKSGHYWKQAIRMLAAYALPAAIMLVPLIKQQAGTASQPDLYHTLLFTYRNAHHYLPQCFPVSDYFKTLTLWSTAALILYRSSSGARTWFGLLTAAVIVFCVLYVVLFSFMGLPFIGKLQAFKSTVFVSYLALVPLVLYIGEKIGAIRFSPLLNNMVLPLTISGILFLFVTNSSMLAESRWQGRYKVGNYAPDDLERMHLWIRENTPKDAVFVSFASDESFLCEARRSLVVAYKGIIHTPEFMIPWYEKMKAVYRVPILENACKQNVISRADSAYAHLPDSAISKQIPFGFRLWKGGPGRGSGPMVHREGEFVLTRCTLP